MKKLNYIWKNHRLLLVGFLLASVVTFMFLARFVFSVIYFSYNQDVAIEPWMPVGYVARSYNVDREWLAQQTGLPAGEVWPMESIKSLAEAAGISFEEMRLRLQTAIESERLE